MGRYISILVLGFTVGCSSTPDAGNWDTLPTREIVISKRHPHSDFLKVRLLTIAEGGLTEIQVDETGEVLRAVPGDFFVPSYFGRHGLQLLGASRDRGEAHLLRIGAK